MGREIAWRANAGQTATHALSRLWATKDLHGMCSTGGQSLCGFEISAPSGDVGRAARPPITALESCLEQTVAHYCWGSRPPPPGQSWKSNDDVQKELQVAELEDELACMRLLYMARVARLAPPYVLAMLQTGAAATWRTAVVKDMERVSQLLSPKLDALGSPREMPARWEEFMKTWPRQWQSLVALFA